MKTLRYYIDQGLKKVHEANKALMIRSSSSLLPPSKKTAHPNDDSELGLNNSLLSPRQKVLETRRRLEQKIFLEKNPPPLEPPPSPLALQKA